MSYAKFKKECDVELKKLGDDFGCPIDAEIFREKIIKATTIVFQLWMEGGCYEELVSWFVKNFDCGGGDEYLEQLVKALVAGGYRESLRKLLRCAINTREKSYWDWSQMTATKGASEQVQRLYGETTHAFKTYIRILEELGPETELTEIREAFECFSEGRRSKLKRKFDEHKNSKG